MSPTRRASNVWEVNAGDDILQVISRSGSPVGGIDSTGAGFGALATVISSGSANIVAAGAIALISGNIVSSAGGQVIQDSGVALSNVQVQTNVATGCMAGCNYGVGLGGDGPAAFGGTTNTLAVANQGQFIKFYNNALRRLGNAVVRSGNTTGAGGHFSIGVYSIAGNTATLIWTSGSQSTATANTNFAVTPTPVNLLAGASYYIGWCADNTTADLTGVSNSGVTSSLGAAGIPNSYGVNAVDVCTAGVLPATVTVTNIVNDIRASFPAIYATNPIPVDTIVADGDSITAGVSETPWTSLLSLNQSWSIFNVATFNQTLANDLVNALTATDHHFVSSGKSISVIWAGTNDISNAGTSPADTYAILAQYIAARKAKGAKVITATMLSRVHNDTGKNAYNALILANSGGAQGTAGQWDSLVDFTNTPLGCDGCYTNTTYFLAGNGGVHPNQFSINTIEAPMFSAAINGLVFS